MDDTEKLERRIVRANERTIEALSSSLSQDKAVLSMGTRFRIQVTQDREANSIRSLKIGFLLVDREALGYLATLLRPFQLKSEEIYYRNVVAAVSYFAVEDKRKAVSRQLESLWETCNKDRTRTFYSSCGEKSVTGEVGDSRIANRVLYSQIVHADQPEEFLEYIPKEKQQWSLEGLVGDWIATASYQQMVMHMVRPDLVPEVTKWAGNELTVFNRFGLNP